MVGSSFFGVESVMELKELLADLRLGESGDYFYGHGPCMPNMVAYEREKAKRRIAYRMMMLEIQKGPSRQPPSPSQRGGGLLRRAEGYRAVYAAIHRVCAAMRTVLASRT